MSPSPRRNGAGGRLVIVGSGVKSIAQCTIEARREIESADVVFTLVPDPVAMHWLHQLNSNIRPLDDWYQRCDHRWNTYQAMVETLLAAVRQQQRVVAVFYGHPGVFVDPSHEAIRRARAEGYEAHMQAGISAEDCLFADLGVDPAEVGCQSYEATQFLVWPRQFDARSALVLWQIGVLGDLTLTRTTPLPGALRLLTRKLLAHYPADHAIALYESATLDTARSHIEWLPLQRLPYAKPSHVATLFVPPHGELVADEDTVAALRLPDNNLYFSRRSRARK